MVFDFDSMKGPILAILWMTGLALIVATPTGPAFVSLPVPACSKRIGGSRRSSMPGIASTLSRRVRAPCSFLGGMGRSQEAVTLFMSSDVSALGRALSERMGKDAGEGWTALDRLAEVSKRGGMSQRDWSVLFGELAKSESFVRMWGRQAFKLDIVLDMAKGSFGMEDLKKHAHDYPYFYAGIGTLVDGGGWMMAKFDKNVEMEGRTDCMQAEEVEEQLAK